MKVVIVRAAEDARRTAARLEAAGHQAVVAPVLEIRALDFAAPAGAFDAVVATSAHAFGRPGQLASLVSLPLFAVGARTADAAQDAGFAAARVVAPNAAELVAAATPALSGRRVLYLAGRDRKPDLESALGAHCALVVVETYVAEPSAALASAAVEALADDGAAVLHYSSRSATIFLNVARQAGAGEQLGGARHIAISGDAAQPLRAAGLRVAVAAQPNEESMIDELARIGTGANRAGEI